MSAESFLFDTGHVVRTPAALATLVQMQVSEWSLIQRHRLGDYGDIEPAERASNEQALLNGGAVFSAYRLADGVVLWIISEPYYMMTTMLRPFEYGSRFPNGLAARKEAVRLACLPATRGCFEAHEKPRFRAA